MAGEPQNFDYNARVTAARIMYETWIPRIDGQTGVHGLPHIFEWVQVIQMIGTN